MIGLEPALSVVLVTDRYETIRTVIAHLRRQTVRERLEIVIVAPPGQAVKAEGGEELEGFAAARVVEGSIIPLARARATGVRAASAPLVFIGETHSYPRPDCMERFLHARAEGWPVVVPGFANANPDGALSWASFVVDYAGWWEGLPPGEIEHAPCYNTACDRSALLEFGDRLENAFSHGDDFLEGLHRRGHRIYFEPAAIVEHLNGSTRASLKPRYGIGRMRGADRGERWPASRRAVYVFGAPLIPAVLFWRLRASLGLLRKRTRLPRGTLPAVAGVLAIAACGEMVGYAMGAAPGIGEKVDDFEIHKLRFTPAGAST
ncbi:MAG TPA: hypothetical protein VM778_03900 [Gemmatimonadota bacterium]|nr:hypothetical protein [Gemmatimonadota bacterium]